MSTNICLYFQVHQPNRLRKYTYFDIGKVSHYEDDEKNKEVLLKVAAKCYLPMNQLLLELIERYAGNFKVAFSLSGVVLDQLQRWSPETIASFQRLAETGCVEFLNETYYHSLSFLYSEREFIEQVKLHQRTICDLFNYRATTFRNTELIYSDRLACLVAGLGYRAMLMEGADRVLGKQSPNFIYHPSVCKKLKLLLKNYRLSDDIAFRFSNRTWNEYPLTAEKYVNWIAALENEADCINLFMDYETFGEHQWFDTGIFEFMRHFPALIFDRTDIHFLTPAEAAKTLPVAGVLSVPECVSWADVDRDLTAWRGNDLQRDSLDALYQLEKSVRGLKNKKRLHDWRTLQTSDHFYYMCTKWSEDGDVHKYFSPYHNPYDAYINFQNILTDFTGRILSDQKRTHKGLRWFRRGKRA